MNTDITALQKELTATKLQLALAVALHDRLLEENRALKAPVVFKMAPRSAEQTRLDAGYDKHDAERRARGAMGDLMRLGLGARAEEGNHA